MERRGKEYSFPAREILIPALQVGAFTGSTGSLIGGLAGTLRTTTPILFAIASGLQWFALGTTFWATRSTLLHAWDLPHPTPKDRLYVSTISGSISGGLVGGLIRGRRNVIPGTIMFTLFGYVGQRAYTFLDERHTGKMEKEAREQKEGKKKEGFLERVAGMKWSPLTKISNAEYEAILSEGLERVEEELVVVEGEMERLREEERRWKERKEREARERREKEKEKERMGKESVEG